MADRNFLAVFILANFAFIEVIFDYSLLLRSGPYQEMLFFIFLGIYLFDFSFKDRARVFLSGYFLLFAVYIHPMAVFFVVSFILGVLIHTVRTHKFSPNLILLLAAAFVGIYHLLYFQLFYPKPLSRGAWFRSEFISLSDLSFNRLPHLMGKLFTDFKITFENIFSFEFNYGLSFFSEGQATKLIFLFLNRAVIYLSFGVLVFGLFFSIKTLFKLKTNEKKATEWLNLFFLFLFGTFLGRLFLLSPKPFYEPRHNIDLAICVLMGYLCVFSRVYKIKRLFSLKSVALLLILMAFTVPHAHYFLKAVKFKETSHREILAVLESNGVKYLTTDWVITYSLYLLSHRRIIVTDSLGPLTIPFFFPKLRALVDSVPESQKAYLFFSDNYPRQESHKKITRFKKTRVLDTLNRQNIPRKVVKLDYYTIIIPEPARFFHQNSERR